MGRPVNRPILSLLRLAPEEAGAARLLGRFSTGHPGVKILMPHYPDEPWRASLDAGSVPGDSREMILTAHRPSELLGKLEKLFAGDPEDDSG